MADIQVKKVNRFLVRELGVQEREQLMLYIVNMGSAEEGWGPGLGWTLEEYRLHTRRLRESTEKLWPELWQSKENQKTDVETRVWAIALKMRTYLRNFWRSDNQRARAWFIHRAREYWQRLYIQPEVLKVDEPIQQLTAEAMLDSKPPAPNPIESALYELQKRAEKPKLAPRVCPNECEQRFFLSTEKGQKYCPECRRSEAARTRASKRKSFHKHKDKWPSTAKRRKQRG
jgi:hypothetical protein